MKVGKTVQGS